MGLDETISRQFREWEFRGRGGRLFERPVALEPPFAPFTGYRLPRQRVDDGRRETILSSLWNRFTAPPPEPEPEEETVDEPEPYFRDATECVELQLTLPDTKPFSAANYEACLKGPFASDPLALQAQDSRAFAITAFAEPARYAAIWRGNWRTSIGLPR